MNGEPLARAEAAVSALFRWYFLEAIAAVCILGSFLGGADALLLLLVGILAGSVSLRLRFGRTSTWARIARVGQVLIGGVGTLAGVVAVVGGIVLATKGSFALLAALMVVPLGAGVGVLSWAMLRIGLSSAPRDPHPSPADHIEAFRRASR